MAEMTVYVQLPDELRQEVAVDKDLFKQVMGLRPQTGKILCEGGREGIARILADGIDTCWPDMQKMLEQGEPVHIHIQVGAPEPILEDA